MTGQPMTPIAWSIDVPLLGQPSIIATFGKIVVLACGLMSGLLAFLSLALDNRETIAPLLALTAISGGVSCVLLLLVVIVFFRNRMSMSYALDSRGARSRTRPARPAVSINRVRKPMTLSPACDADQCVATTFFAST